MNSQHTQPVDRRDLSTPAFIMQAATIQLRKFLEKRGVPTTESSLYAAIHDLLMHMTLQMPGQPGPMQPGGPQFMQGNPQGPMPGHMIPGGGPQMIPGPQGMNMPDHPQGMNPQAMNPQAMNPQVMNPQAMGQMGGQMNQGYGMGQMGGPSGE